VTQALARKYRPRSFAELVGQEHVVQALGNALGGQRLHHAYLFTGTRGVGKTTLARILAKAFNCEQGVSATPCGTCSACTSIDSGRFVDLLEVDAASNTQVDRMRELLENALYAPTSGRFKVYVIDEVHQLSGHSFNAMLKTLEEPPEHVKFILATTDPQKVPVTVLSRCLQFNLRQIPPAQIRSRLEVILEREGIAFEGAALATLAQAARGSLRDALSLLDQAIAHGGGTVAEASVAGMLGLVGREHLHRIAEAVASGNGAQLVAEADAMAGHGLSFDQALQELATLWHRIAVAQLAPDAVVGDEPDAATVRTLAARFPAEEVQLYYQIALQGRADISLAPDEYAGFTMTLLRMLAFRPADAAAPPPPVRTPDHRPLRTAPGTLAAPAPAPQQAPAPVAARREPPPAAAPASAPRDVSPAVQPEPAADAYTSATPIPLPTDWVTMTAGMKISGMVRQLAQNCDLVGEVDGVIELCVPTAHRHLAEKSLQERLRLAMEDYLGRSVRLRITAGEPSGRTPAEMEQQVKQEQLAGALSAIEADPFVRELVSDLGARVVTDSIKPKT
jgi:DNA polymerase-3 subunit gamma/tau